MTRIIGGDAGSLPLKVPPKGTRPTSDRVREAVFSALDARGLVRGARVADLYAGSGALGLEAASRGAASVVLVESSPRAAAVCRANASTVTRAAERSLAIDTIVMPVQGWLDRAAADSFDIVFLDPPYELTDAELARNLESLIPRLAGGAVVLVERSSRSGEPEWPDALVPDKRRAYGETIVWWAEVE